MIVFRHDRSRRIIVLLGIALGLRHSFLILFPAIPCALTIVAAFGAQWPTDYWLTATAMIATVVALQIGYLAGAAIRIAAARQAIRIDSHWTANVKSATNEQAALVKPKVTAVFSAHKRDLRERTSQLTLH